MGGPVEVAGDQLRAIVERIEHIEGEISELNEAKKEIYLEAKSNGFDVKVLREVVRLRKQDQKEREEHESMLEVYLSDQRSSRPQGSLILRPLLPPPAAPPWRPIRSRPPSKALSTQKRCRRCLRKAA